MPSTACIPPKGRERRSAGNVVSDSRPSTLDPRLKKACADFESVLLTYMFKSMKKTVGEGGVFGNSFQKDMYESIFFEKIAEKVAQEKGMGIGEALYRQLAGAFPGSTGSKSTK